MFFPHLQRLWHSLRRVARQESQDLAVLLRMGMKWLLIASAVGVAAGCASALFLVALQYVSATRDANPALLLGLPVVGYFITWAYQRYGGTAGRGNALVIEEVNLNRARIPFRMTPFVLAGAVLTHLFGGSAGREGAAVQMGASLADGLRRLLRLKPEDRRLILMAGISGGFGSAFGMPSAGFVFGMEVQGVGKVNYEGIIPCLVASFVGDMTVRALGVHHTHYPTIAHIPLSPELLFKVGIAAALFGLLSMFFIHSVHAVKALTQRTRLKPPVITALGGIVLLGLTVLVGNLEYNGLSLRLMLDSMRGEEVPSYAFLLKLLFTAITLGVGYLGGETVPLFVMGACFGATLAPILGVEGVLLPALGAVATFGAAANTPIACAVMAVEMFGGEVLPWAFFACALAYLASGRHSIYSTQPVITAKVSYGSTPPANP